MTWRWVDPSAMLALHDQQIAEHGGSSGIRDRNAFESALARPRHQAAYGEPDAAALAAAYAYGLARNHAFADGNKRTAWLAANIFLGLNGYVVVFVPSEAVRIMESTAEGRTTEDQLADWFRQRLAKKRNSKGRGRRATSPSPTCPSQVAASVSRRRAATRRRTPALSRPTPAAAHCRPGLLPGTHTPTRNSAGCF